MSLPARPIAAVLIFLLATATAYIAHAQDFEQRSVASLIEENDLVFDTDRHYTQGIKISYMGADNHVPAILHHLSDDLPSIGFDKRADRVGLAVGQNIYTPADTSTEQLLPKDRPYAGWLYMGLVLQRRGLIADRWVTIESFQLDLGVIGPESLAEQAQTWVHELRSFNTPNGWDNQLETEPGLCFKYQRALRLSPPACERYFDFIPHLGTALGNVDTSLRSGAIMRLGLHLPDDFGIQTINSLLTSEGGRSTAKGIRRWGAHVFCGAEGWLIGHNVTLDGNLFHNSHSVEREWFVTEIKAGLVFDLNRLQLAFTYVSRSQEFHGQGEDNQYGSVSAKVNF